MKIIKIFRKSLIVFSVVVGVLVTTAFFYDEPRNFEITKNMDLFYSVFKEINTFYVDEIDPGKVIKTAIDAMLKSLDPYTVFYPESKIEDFKFMTTGEYGGIGAVVQKRNKDAIVMDVYEKSSAALSGIKAGDHILKINDIDISNKTLDEISELLRGKNNSLVKILVKRVNESQNIEFMVKEQKISIPSVPYSAVLEGDIAYIKFNSFTQNSAEEFKQGLEKFSTKAPLKGIIIDLRGNPGGLLNEAVKIVNYFVPRGEQIVETRGKVEQWNAKYFAQVDPIFPNIPVVVLVNRGSASASEIVSGSLQDLDRAVIVGERTYGKGLVQTTRKIAYNTRIKVTTAKYYIPSGRCIQALDYTNRNEDGSVSHIPDSLISEYFTKNKRRVYDGAGILPDILSDTLIYSKNFRKMMAENKIFDFATNFSSKNPKILSPDSFFIDSSTLKSFFSYLDEENFRFESKSELYFNQLKSELGVENRLDKFKPELDEINRKLDELSYLLKEKDEKLIKKYLGGEIVGRYFYQRGRIQYHIRFDSAVDTALSILSNKNEYNNILLGLAGEHTLAPKK